MPNYTVPSSEPITPESTASPSISNLHNHTMSAAERSTRWHDYMWKALTGKSWEAHKADNPDGIHQDDDFMNQTQCIDANHDVTIENMFTHFESTSSLSLESIATPDRTTSKTSVFDEGTAIKMAIFSWIKSISY
mmetsp:Transcript_8125/g.11427  ORF Transcript_8125/g.11427 Transcript_8125/m.11427 type:complete len:135 (-) Transcript_8125:12-416(-)